MLSIIFIIIDVYIKNIEIKILEKFGYLVISSNLFV